MKLSFISALLCSIFMLGGQSLAWSAEYPEGNLTIYNTSNKKITAQVSTFGKFNIASNEQKTVPYSSLSRACSANTTNCTAQFYADDAPAGSATINVETGKLVNMKLSMKVHTAKGPQQVLRSVVIQ